MKRIITMMISIVTLFVTMIHPILAVEPEYNENFIIFRGEDYSINYCTFKSKSNDLDLYYDGKSMYLSDPYNYDFKFYRIDKENRGKRQIVNAKPSELFGDKKKVRWVCASSLDVYYSGYSNTLLVKASEMEESTLNNDT